MVSLEALHLHSLGTIVRRLYELSGKMALGRLGSIKVHPSNEVADAFRFNTLFPPSVRTSNEVPSLEPSLALVTVALLPGCAP